MSSTQGKPQQLGPLPCTCIKVKFVVRQFEQGSFGGVVSHVIPCDNCIDYNLSLDPDFYPVIVSCNPTRKFRCQPMSCVSRPQPPVDLTQCGDVESNPGPALNLTTEFDQPNYFEGLFSQLGNEIFQRRFVDSSSWFVWVCVCLYFLSYYSRYLLTGRYGLSPVTITFFFGGIVCIGLSFLVSGSYGNPQPYYVTNLLVNNNWTFGWMRWLEGSPACKARGVDGRLKLEFCTQFGKPLYIGLPYPMLLWIGYHATVFWALVFQLIDRYFLFIQRYQLLFQNWFAVIIHGHKMSDKFKESLRNQNIDKAVIKLRDTQSRSILARVLNVYVHMNFSFLPTCAFWMTLARICSSYTFYAVAWDPVFGTVANYEDVENFGLTTPIKLLWHTMFGVTWFGFQVGKFVIPEFTIIIFRFTSDVFVFSFVQGNYFSCALHVLSTAYMFMYSAVVLSGPILLVCAAWTVPVKRLNRWRKPAAFQRLRISLCKSEKPVTDVGPGMYTIDERRAITAASILQPVHVVGCLRSFPRADRSNFLHCGVNRGGSEHVKSCECYETKCTNTLPTFFDLTEFSFPLEVLLNMSVEGFALMFDTSFGSFGRHPITGEHAVLTIDNQYTFVTDRNNKTYTVPHFALEEHGVIRTFYGSLRYSTVSRYDGLKLVRFHPEFRFFGRTRDRYVAHRFDNRIILEGPTSFYCRVEQFGTQVLEQAIPKSVIHNVATRLALIPREDATNVYNVAVNFVRSGIDSLKLKRNCIHWWALLSIKCADELALSASKYQSTMIDNPMQFNRFQRWYFRSWFHNGSWSPINHQITLGYAPWDFSPVYVPTYTVISDSGDVEFLDPINGGHDQPFSEVREDVATAVADDASTGSLSDTSEYHSIDGSARVETEPLPAPFDDVDGLFQGCEDFQLHPRAPRSNHSAGRSGVSIKPAELRGGSRRSSPDRTKVRSVAPCPAPIAGPSQVEPVCAGSSVVNTGWGEIPGDRKMPEPGTVGGIPKLIGKPFAIAEVVFSVTQENNKCYVAGFYTPKSATIPRGNPDSDEPNVEEMFKQCSDGSDERFERLRGDLSIVITLVGKLQKSEEFVRDNPESVLSYMLSEGKRLGLKRAPAGAH